MSYTGAESKVEITLTPEYFRKSALAYNNSYNRKQWLERELINLRASVYQYQEKMIDLQNRGARLDGKSDVATWLTSIGATVGTVGTAVPVVSIIGWVAAGAGVIWNALERKKDTKAARELTAEAAQLAAEAQTIQQYYTQYSSEITGLKIRPAIIGGALAIIATKRK